MSYENASTVKQQALLFIYLIIIIIKTRGFFHYVLVVNENALKSLKNCKDFVYLEENLYNHLTGCKLEASFISLKASKSDKSCKNKKYTESQWSVCFLCELTVLRTSSEQLVKNLN